MIRTALAAALIITRTIVPGAKGPSRLDPDVDLLGHCAAQFADLRLHDARGAEVPYLVIEPPSEKPRWETATAKLPVAQTKTASGFDADFGEASAIDQIRIDGIAPPFLKRLRIEASGDRAHWSIVAPDATIFDLPEQKLRNIDVDVAPGAYRYVRVTWDDRASARVTYVGDVSARLVGRVAPPPRISAAVSFRRVASEAGRSRYRLTLPAPHLPVTHIELQVGDGDVYRDASVVEPRLSGATIAPVTLGTGILRRTTREGGVAADLAVAIGTPESHDLELVIDDGNNPPLPITAITARLAPQPWIYFESDGAPLTATYGTPNATAPRYDLEASRRYATTATTVNAAWSAPAPTARSETVEGALPVGGAPIDRKPFRYARPIAGEPRGLTSLLLDAEVLAHSASLGDVRIIDARNTQVPYLIERRDAPLTITLTVPQRTREGASSVYRFALPYDSLPAGTRIVFTTTARVFERDVTLRRTADETHGREAQPIAADRWANSDPAAPPPQLVFDSLLAGGNAVELIVADGDNAPLPIASAQLLLPSYALRFVGPGSKLTLLYGANIAAPHYDLALLAPRLFGESATEITLASPAKETQPSHLETRLFWIAIAGVAMALLLMLGRLLKNVSA